MFENFCVGCNIQHVEDRSNALKCEYCNKLYCLECSNMSSEMFATRRQMKALHWFCPRCELKAVRTLKTEGDIEERCSKFLIKFEKRVTALETR